MKKAAPQKSKKALKLGRGIFKIFWLKPDWPRHTPKEKSWQDNKKKNVEIFILRDGTVCW